VEIQARRKMSAPIKFSRRSVLAVVIASNVVNILATTMYLPGIPAIAAELAADVQSVQLLLTAYLATSALGQLVLGPLSDATGRRGLVIFGAVFSAFIAVVCAIATSVDVLIGLRLVQGVTGSAFVVAVRSIVRDINDRSGTARDMAGILLAISFVAPISQSVGGVLTELVSWRSTFGVMAGISCLTFLLALYLLPETNLRRANRPSFRSYAGAYTALLFSREFHAYAAMNIILFATLYFFYNAFPIILIKSYRLSPSGYGPVALLCASGIFLGSLISNRMAIGRDPDWLLCLGISVSGLAGIAMLAPLVCGTLPLSMVIAIPFVWFVGYGISLPNAIAGAMSACPSASGASAALLGFVQIGAGAGGSAISGVIRTPTGLFLTIAGLAMANLVIRFSTLRRPLDLANVPDH